MLLKKAKGSLIWPGLWEVSANAVHEWLNRYREGGMVGLRNRSSRPRHSPRATAPAICEAVVALRCQRQTYHQVAHLGLGTSTVGRRPKKRGLNHLATLEPAAG